jgi:hypothetical protein
VVKKNSMKDKIDALNDKIAEAHLGGGKNRDCKKQQNKKQPQENVSII